MITFKIDIFNLYKEFQKLKRTIPRFIESDKDYEISFFPKEELIPVKLLSEKGILVISNNSIIKSWILELPVDYNNVHVEEPENIKPFSAWIITQKHSTKSLRNSGSSSELPN